MAACSLVDPEQFLGPLGLTQYKGCLMANVGHTTSRVAGLSRDKLSQLHIYQLSQMNITQFEHQKAIMARIRELPSIPTQGDPDSAGSKLDQARTVDPEPAPSSPRRGSGALEAASGAPGETGGCRTNPGPQEKRRGSLGGRRVSRASIDASMEAIMTARQRGDAESKSQKIAALRHRGSFSGAIDSGSKSRVRSEGKQDKSGADPEVQEEEMRPPRMATSRRLSTGTIDDSEVRREEAAAKRAKALEYGNKALKSSKLEHELNVLRSTVLASFVDTIDCERATLMFHDKRHDELFFFEGVQCIRFPASKGVAGYCAASGERLTVNDPYSNKHFNPAIDQETGFVTRNILCQPVLSRINGGVLAVLQMVNKRDEEGFTANDSAVMEMAVLQVSEALETKFSELQELQVQWQGHRAGSARGSRKGSIGAPPRYMEENTRSMTMSPAEHVTDPTELRRGSSEGTQMLVTMSKADKRDSFLEAEKLRRRNQYGKEVRESAVGLL